MFEQQIEKGIEYLNTNHTGWLEKIDLEILDMDHSMRCIIGQLKGNYFAWSSDNVLLNKTALGFLAESEIIDTLTKEWKARILELRAKSDMATPT